MIAYLFSVATPLVGSSRMSSFGRIATLIQTSRIFLSPCGIASASVSRFSARPNSSSRSTASARVSSSQSRTVNRELFLRSRERIAERTFSTSVRSSQTRGIWKERTSPARARSWTGDPCSDFPSKTISPDVASSTPVSRLTKVVLPAPFGPMMPTISPLSTSKSIPSTALRSPNSLVRPWVSGTDISAHLRGLASVESCGGSARRCLEMPSGSNTITRKRTSPIRKCQYSVSCWA